METEIEEKYNFKAYYCLVTFSILLTVYVVLKYLKYHGVPDNFPPGPPCVPFLGVLPFIKVFKTQCGNSQSFLLLRFYVVSLFGTF